MICTTLMVHLDVGRSNAELLRVTADLATQLDARLVGIAACQPAQILDTTGYALNDMISACREELESELRDAEAEFHAAFKDHKFSLEWRSSYTATALAEYIAHEARCADFIVTSALPAEVFDTSRHVSIGELVLQAGRPIILVPPTGTRAPFERITVAWTDTREARRAIVDALPLLAMAKDVTIIEIAEAGQMDAARARVQDVATWLAQHSIGAVPLAVLASGDKANQRRSVLSEGADLIVAGAYRHSRLREWAFGGVTRELLLGNHCALLSH